MNKSEVSYNYQNFNTPNKVVWNFLFGVCYLFVICNLLLGISNAYAQDVDKVSALTKQIIETKDNQDLYVPFEELKDIYFKENKYSEFVDFLKSLEAKKKALGLFLNYYIGLSRYNQLKHLEEAQLWDEYFSRGNNYRDEITGYAQKAIQETKPDSALNVYSRLLLWQFHRDQQDVFSEEALTSLMSSSLSYSESAKDIQPIKVVADRLSSYGERGKSKELYKVYVEKIASSDIKDDQLENIAKQYYSGGNLELSETIYDGYIDRVTESADKEKSIPVLVDIAKEFAYKSAGLKDPAYAEKLFAKIEELGGKGTFDQGLLYLRAFNLEKSKEYSKAKDFYAELIRRYPESAHANEAEFKLGIIYTYIIKDLEQGKSYFEKLAEEKDRQIPQVISSLYELGLIAQWEGDADSAKSYYNMALEAAGDNFAEIADKARKRLKEIEEDKPIDYNLKTFLDICLKKDNGPFDMTRLDLSANPAVIKKDENVDIISTAYTGQTGCMQVELNYLWSGDLGKSSPSAQESSFQTQYRDPGTKIINLAVVSPTGFIDYSINMVDVY